VENIQYGSQGWLDIKITRISDAKVLLKWTGNVGGLWGGTYMRPKWGFYRSLNDRGALRDESVHFTDICVGEGFNNCK
jgi:hypothetical protein